MLSLLTLYVNLPARPTNMPKWNEEQLYRLSAFIEREQRKGTSRKKAIERFVFTYGQKAVDNHTLESWYNNCELSKYDQSTLQQKELESACDDLDLLPGLRCEIKHPIRTAGWEKDAYSFLAEAIDVRYVFLYHRYSLYHIFVLDLFTSHLQ